MAAVETDVKEPITEAQDYQPSFLLELISNPPECIASIHISIPNSNRNEIIHALFTAYHKKSEPNEDEGKLRLIINQNETSNESAFTFLDLNEWVANIKGKFNEAEMKEALNIIEIRPIIKARPTAYMSILFDTLEHKSMGDDAFKIFYNTILEKKEDVENLLPHFKSDLSGWANIPTPMTFGSIVALAGDFFGLSKTPISDAEDKEAEKRFLLSVQDLFEGKYNLLLGLALLNLAYWNPPFINVWYTLITGGKYIMLAKNNIDHFVPDSHKVYHVGHMVAIQKAIEASKQESISVKKKMLIEAIRLEAFACHYLTDSFAAGHLRVPRRAMHRIGKDLAAKDQHDEDGLLGLNVENTRVDDSGCPIPDKWRTFGDDALISAKGKRSKDPEKRKAYEKVLEATTQAIQDVWESYKRGTPVLNVYPLIPTKLSDNNHFAMFKVEDGKLKKRKGNEHSDKYENYPKHLM